jgi:hypothetical protein
MTEQGNLPENLKDPTSGPKKIHLQSIRDGAVTLSIWEQSKGDQSQVQVSIGKAYRDGETGEQREGRNFNSHDLQKLRTMLPFAEQELKKWQAYCVQKQPPVQQKSEAVAQRDAALAERQEGLTTQRDSVMQEANRHFPPHTPVHDHSR